jgi:hypothetical protein
MSMHSAIEFERPIALDRLVLLSRCRRAALSRQRAGEGDVDVVSVSVVQVVVDCHNEPRNAKIRARKLLLFVPLVSLVCASSIWWRMAITTVKQPQVDVDDRIAPPDTRSGQRPTKQRTPSKASLKLQRDSEIVCAHFDGQVGHCHWGVAVRGRTLRHECEERASTVSRSNEQMASLVSDDESDQGPTTRRRRAHIVANLSLQRSARSQSSHHSHRVIHWRPHALARYCSGCLS